MLLKAKCSQLACD